MTTFPETSVQFIFSTRAIQRVRFPVVNPLRIPALSWQAWVHHHIAAAGKPTSGGLPVE
jgi:hypothetical protein